MKVLFVGPSLFGANVDLANFDVRGPAAQGDVARAVRDGAQMIGLVDGLFGSVASVWHKEILAALDSGVVVYGASSMGALRAAECAAFGMVPVGRIAAAYLDGRLDDDAEVALTFGPRETGWMPFTEPMVDVRRTLLRLRAEGCISSDVHDRLSHAARRLHFTERTPERFIEAAALGAGTAQVQADYQRYRVSQKQLDALDLIARMRDANLHREVDHWDFSSSPMWRRFMATDA